jgi:hypothetical protein
MSKTTMSSVEVLVSMLASPRLAGASCHGLRLAGRSFRLAEAPPQRVPHMVSIPAVARGPAPYLARRATLGALPPYPTVLARPRSEPQTSEPNARSPSARRRPSEVSSLVSFSVSSQTERSLGENVLASGTERSLCDKPGGKGFRTTGIMLLKVGACELIQFVRQTTACLTERQTTVSIPSLPD